MELILRTHNILINEKLFMAIKFAYEQANLIKVENITHISSLHFCKRPSTVLQKVTSKTFCVINTHE